LDVSLSLHYGVTSERLARGSLAQAGWVLNVCGKMPPPKITSPLTFEPIFMERMWGGRKLESEFGKNLPPNKRIGESWEIVDRPEAQSVVTNGPLKGKTLHELWTKYQKEVFGEAPKTRRLAAALPDRFPLLIKLLDARDKLSLQVHPPGRIAAQLGGEPKTECWYVAAAEPGAELYVGFRESITRERFEKSLRAGSAADHLHTIKVKAGDAMFLPAGRFHAIGAGNLLVEIQQNSDTTYRVFDWNRVDQADKPRQLHVDQALKCIDFNDVTPGLVEAKGESLVRHQLFEGQKWNLGAVREVAPREQFAIIGCLSGKVTCAGVDLAPGEFLLMPAWIQDRELKPLSDQTNLLRVTIPS
jgi:mannose-6-phosphate isomerase